MIIQPGKFQYYFLDDKMLEELHERTHQARNESDGDLPVDQMINGHAVEVSFIGSNTKSTPLPFGQSTESPCLT